MDVIFDNKKTFYQKSIQSIILPNNISMIDMINPYNSKYLYNTSKQYNSGDICFTNTDNPSWFKCKSSTKGSFDPNKWLTINTFDTVDYILNKFSELIGDAPEALDTLNELSNALNNDANFATTILNKIGEKANSNHEHHSLGYEEIFNGDTNRYISSLIHTLSKVDNYGLELFYDDNENSSRILMDNTGISVESNYNVDINTGVKALKFIGDGSQVSNVDAKTLSGKSLSDLQNYNNLSNKPTGLKNPQSLNINFNGNPETDYDGSEYKTINITPGAIGAALSTHKHSISEIINLSTSTLDLYKINFENEMISNNTEIDAFCIKMNRDKENDLYAYTRIDHSGLSCYSEKDANNNIDSLILGYESLTIGGSDESGNSVCSFLTKDKLSFYSGSNTYTFDSSGMEVENISLRGNTLRFDSPFMIGLFSPGKTSPITSIWANSQAIDLKFGQVNIQNNLNVGSSIDVNDSIYINNSPVISEDTKTYYGVPYVSTTVPTSMRSGSICVVPE